MIDLAKAIGRVMMTAVSNPRPKYTRKNLETYVTTEFRKGDQPYIMDCMINGKTIDYKFIV